LGPGADPDPWLDPVAMQQVTQLAADTLTRADPAGRATYQAAARAYRAQLEALDIDYRSSLADCARHDIVTADHAFAAPAARYGFADHGAGDAGIDQLVKAKGIGVVFTEPGVTTGAVEALAHATHAKVDQLDTLLTVSPEQTGRGATYLSLMTDNLARLRAALDCTSGP
jgi:zinc transport system substrate-binding protein